MAFVRALRKGEKGAVPANSSSRTLFPSEEAPREAVSGPSFSVRPCQRVVPTTRCKRTGEDHPRAGKHVSTKNAAGRDPLQGLRGLLVQGGEALTTGSLRPSSGPWPHGRGMAGGGKTRYTIATGGGMAPERRLPRHSGGGGVDMEEQIGAGRERRREQTSPGV